LPISKRSVAFAFELSVLVPDYKIDGTLWLKRHFEGGYLYRELIIVEATPNPDAPGGWAVTYGFQSKTPNAARKKAATALLPNEAAIAFSIPVVQDKRPGINAALRIEARLWN